ncbi:hypothetical protein ACI6QG_14340 [Roseococcus sp. DSY-14]|uniref:hypothetical protein n=1 Tax=Roseococcus sp. DSY-14 TaxID=3369650 RepID=UPI00387ADD85
MLRPALLLLLAFSAPAAAETWRVGPGEALRLPSEAAARAGPGDTVLLAAGTYADCAVWRAPGVTVAAMEGAAPVITGPVCAGKGLFVAAAPGLVVRGLTFRGARAAEGNGAGIRAEGGDLTVLASRFEDNENGILTSPSGAGWRLVVEDSAFLRNGALLRECAHGIYAGQWAEVVVRRSRFADTRVCHHLKSRAARTELSDSVVEDGPDSLTSYLVDTPNGGDLLLRGNTLVKGPRTDNPLTAVMIGAEGVRHPTRSLVIEGNRFESRLEAPVFFVFNRTAAPVRLEGNQLRGRVVPLGGPEAR